jgi:hypothetical protein
MMDKLNEYPIAVKVIAYINQEKPKIEKTNVIEKGSFSFCQRK